MSDVTARTNALRAGPRGASRPVLGVGLMIAAMTIVPVADGLGKYLNKWHSPVSLSWARYAAGLIFVLLVTMLQRRDRRQVTRQELPAQALRGVFLVGAMTLFYIAIAYVPLTDALGAYFVSPIIATILSFIVLREPLSLRRLVAVAVGFIGALIIVQPGASMSVGMLYALGSGFSMGCYLVTTRVAVLNSSPFTTLAIQYIVGALLLTPFAVWDWKVPTGWALSLMLLMGLCSAVSHLLVINAFRLAPASTLSPFVYFELVGATIFSLAVFGDFPSPVTWAGITVVVAAGLAVAAPAMAMRPPTGASKRG